MGAGQRRDKRKENREENPERRQERREDLEPEDLEDEESRERR